MTAQTPMTDVDDSPPITSLRRALAVLGDPWTMLILKEAYNGIRRFGEFQRNLNIPKQTLSLRLSELCRQQMLYRQYLNANAGTILYFPTAKTYDLQEAMYSIWLWHRANPSPVDPLPFDLVHVPCGKLLSASYCCTHCGEPATRESVKAHPATAGQVDEARQRLARRNDAAITAALDSGDTPIAASLIGDIPCNEVLYRLFQGPQHLLALARELELGQAVLRDRLNKLLALELVREEKQGRLAVFSTLPRAEHFYPLLLSLAAWGDRWCNDTSPPPEIRVHACGNLLNARFRCAHCGGWVGRNTISFQPRVQPA